MAAAIEIEGLRKEYRRARGGRTIAVDGLDLQVPAGGVFGFLGVESAQVSSIPSDNSRSFVQDGPKVRAIGPVIRAGATVGQFLPPEVWRKVSKPLVAQLHRNGDSARPKLTPEQRGALLEPHLPDIELLERVTGESFEDWKGYRDGGSFESRRAGPRA